MRALALITAAAMAATLAGPTCAGDFALSATPPRFELKTRPGAVLREVLEIDNVSGAAAIYGVETADWTLDADGGVVFSKALAPGSCRPWVAIERHEVTIPGHGVYRYRFEVQPPAEAAAKECRFALMIEGADETVRTASGVGFPVTGRLGVIVYVTLPGAAPALSIVGASVRAIAGEPTPIIAVKNSGEAHGRLQGFLSGVDAKGRHFDFAPSTLPILPGETRDLALIVDRADPGAPAHIAFPIVIRGKLQGAPTPIAFSQRFEP